MCFLFFLDIKSESQRDDLTLSVCHFQKLDLNKVTVELTIHPLH